MIWDMLYFYAVFVPGMLMRIRLCIVFLILLTFVRPAGAIAPYLDNPYAHPPRTIRVCCMFGSKVGIAVLPFIKLSAVTSLERIGMHRYLGKVSENNGIIYTRTGGFIDLGHMRDQADWTAYLYGLMQQEKHLECITLDLGYEGGEKKLSISVPGGMTDDDLLLLAGRIAYDISIWHEIGTWFGVSSVPLVSEQFSSFSVEDGYSNLLGVFTGMKAVKSNLPYDEAMTILIREELQELGVVRTESETLQAMEDVRDIWWTRDALMPSNWVMIARQTTTYDSIFPKLVPRDALMIRHKRPLIIPSVTSRGDSLSHFYEFSIKLNHKFPTQFLFPGKIDQVVTHHDFMTMIHHIDNQLDNGFLIRPKNDFVSYRKPDLFGIRKFIENEKKN
jgi:hypothetical protein